MLYDIYLEKEYLALSFFYYKNYLDSYPIIVRLKTLPKLIHSNHLLIIRPYIFLFYPFFKNENPDKTKRFIEINFNKPFCFINEVNLLN